MWQSNETVEGVKRGQHFGGGDRVMKTCTLPPALKRQMDTMDILERTNHWAIQSPALRGSALVGCTVMFMSIFVVLLLISFQPPLACRELAHGRRELSTVRIIGITLLAATLAAAWPTWKIVQLHMARSDAVQPR